MTSTYASGRCISTIAWSNELSSLVEGRGPRFGVFSKPARCAPPRAPHCWRTGGGIFLGGLSSLVDEGLLLGAEVEGHPGRRFECLRRCMTMHRAARGRRCGGGGARAPARGACPRRRRARAPELLGRLQGRPLSDSGRGRRASPRWSWFPDAEAGSEMLGLRRGLGRSRRSAELGHSLEGRRTLEQALELAVAVPGPSRRRAPTRFGAGFVLGISPHALAPVTRRAVQLLVAWTGRTR